MPRVDFGVVFVEMHGLAILIRWRFWWKNQKVYYAKEYLQVLSVAEKGEEKEGDKREESKV